MVKNKKDIWSWVGDGKVVEKFRELKISEVVFFSLFAFLYSWDQFSGFLAYLWVGVWAILLISRYDILISAFGFSKVSCGIFFQVNPRVYLCFLFSVAVALGIILIFPNSWVGIKIPINLIASSITFFDEVWAVLKEEILYRLLLYYSLNRLLGRSAAFLGTVVMFSLMHHENSFYYPFATAPAGILFSIFAIATGSIWASFLLHLIFNLIVYIFVFNFL